MVYNEIDEAAYSIRVLTSEQRRGFRRIAIWFDLDAGNARSAYVVLTRRNEATVMWRSCEALRFSWGFAFVVPPQYVRDFKTERSSVSRKDCLTFRTPYPNTEILSMRNLGCVPVPGEGQLAAKQ